VRAIPGKLKVSAEWFTGGRVVVRVAICDEDGNELAAWPRYELDGGSFLLIQPVYLHLKANATSEVDLQFILNPDDAHLDVQEGGEP
jgi:hypothetical protein